ncbi:hypothetical protein [Altericista sp. CCNU0014]
MRYFGQYASCPTDRQFPRDGRAFLGIAVSFGEKQPNRCNLNGHI